MAKKVYRSREQAEAAKEKAALFEENVLGDQDAADAIRDESLSDWLSRTKRKIVEKNPRCLVSPHIFERTARKEGQKMPRETRADVEADRDALLDKVEELRDLADDILSDYEPEDEESEEDDGEDNGDDRR